MPFYDYKCNKCGQKFEACHGMSGPPADLACEHCGAKDIKRIFHPVGRLGKSADLPEMPAMGGGGGGGCSGCSASSCGGCH